MAPFGPSSHLLQRPLKSLLELTTAFGRFRTPSSPSYPALFFPQRLLTACVVTSSLRNPPSGLFGIFFFMLYTPKCINKTVCYALSGCGS
ncbi:hypothetical protein L209DRAFT_293847 [Thermothelomyces heterothallicus CBS 203.75]